MSFRHSLIVGAAMASCVPVLTGLAWSQSSPAPAPHAISSKILAQSDGPWSDAITVIAQMDLAPGAQIARHTQPGQERIYVVAGRGELLVDGEPNRQMQAGEAAFIAFGKAHSFTNGNTQTRLQSTLIVAKGQPLAPYLTAAGEMAMSTASNAAPAPNGTRAHE